MVARRRQSRGHVLDWSEAGQGDAPFDLAVLTLGHEEHLGDVVAGYGIDVEVDVEVIHGWWSLRSLRAIRWLLGARTGRRGSHTSVAVLLRIPPDRELISDREQP